MPLYRHVHPMRQDFPNLQRADGTWVGALDPGETVDLDADPVERVDLAGTVIGHHPGCVWLEPGDHRPATSDTRTVPILPVAPGLVATPLPAPPAEQ